MSNTTTKITLNTTGLDLPQLYEAIARELGFNPADANIRFDCRKILVADNIQAALFQTYRELHPELRPSEVTMSVAMLLACSGPKVDDTLADDEIVIEDGFISAA